MSDFVCLFSGLSDFRGFHGRRYRLDSLLSLILVGLLCGRDSLASIWRLSQSLTTEQRLALGFDKWRLPSHPILTGLLSGLDAEALEQHLSHIVRDESGAPLHLALDGKTLRGSRTGESRALHVLSAFSHELSAVLHQEAMDSTENEVGAAFRLLEKLELKNTIITGDAMFAHPNICHIITHKGGDYLFVFKDNRKSQREAIEQTLNAADKKTVLSEPC